MHAALWILNSQLLVEGSRAFFGVHPPYFLLIVNLPNCKTVLGSGSYGSIPSTALLEVGVVARVQIVRDDAWVWAWKGLASTVVSID